MMAAAGCSCYLHSRHPRRRTFRIVPVNDPARHLQVDPRACLAKRPRRTAQSAQFLFKSCRYARRSACIATTKGKGPGATVWPRTVEHPFGSATHLSSQQPCAQAHTVRNGSGFPPMDRVCPTQLSNKPLKLTDEGRQLSVDGQRAGAAQLFKLNDERRAAPAVLLSTSRGGLHRLTASSPVVPKMGMAAWCRNSGGRRSSDGGRAIAV